MSKVFRVAVEIPATANRDNLFDLISAVVHDWELDQVPHRAWDAIVYTDVVEEEI